MCIPVYAISTFAILWYVAFHFPSTALGEYSQVEGVSLTFLDAGHCPGSAMAAFEAPGIMEGLILHTGGSCAAGAGRVLQTKCCVILRVS